MKRTVFRKASAIVCGDFHLRDDQPVCRTDDFQTAQWAKVEQIRQLQITHSCPVIHSGDLFHHWKPSPYLLSQTIRYLPKQFWTIYGNHDLPQHSLDLANKSGVYTLWSAGQVRLLNAAHWGVQLPDDLRPYTIEIGGRSILVWHVMTWRGKSPWPGCQAPSAETILRGFPQFDLIVTGHHHKTFVEEVEGRQLVNPGSLTRQKADQAGHRPCVFLWYSEDNHAVLHPLRYEEGVISREHLEQVEQWDARITAFIERLGTEWEAGVSFEENMERFAANNKVRKSVMDIIRKAIDHGTET